MSDLKVKRDFPNTLKFKMNYYENTKRHVRKRNEMCQKED